ncbi:MAG: Spx/MgsR family RNA polymerase-binding regulatory protein [Verrucomicrobiota bacterium]
MLKIYTYAKCSTCRNALKWLDSKEIAYRNLAIRETPPPVSELKKMLNAHDGNIRRLLNTSSQDYRELGIKDRLDDMPVADVFGLIQQNGNLVKRPFVISPEVKMTGFKPDEWQQQLL